MQRYAATQEKLIKSNQKSAWSELRHIPNEKKKKDKKNQL